ncbi:glycerol-3-phosphate 1-O-acyltransferase PlsY [Dokdonella immobilis]|uniref:Glycerol-3-phosphate acyltransferase n=1 Tax=Dokdonella immobilis TaxID=578942 RepID=A0A1I4VK04_9GAMM|nr:glycerol-3-phosphate 1-O-acyltransferase PlsY [Dokdonella immobilis]SFN01541.1 glycerol-3-phosphate acyltransferase PlsY [Dokdonella immobilis]
MAFLIAQLIVAYLLGSISGSLVLGHLRGVDIRTQGSGNAGGTNALRVAGWRFALGVVAIDVGKGALAAWLGGLSVAGLDQPAWWSSPLLAPCACAFAAVLGHCWPVYFGFRGGKGAGTAFGALLVMAPLLAGIMFTVWLAVIAAFRYVGFATVLGALAFPVGLWLLDRSGHAFPPALAAFALAIAALILFTHRANLRRMVRGEEPRIGRAARSP